MFRAMSKRLGELHIKAQQHGKRLTKTDIGDLITIGKVLKEPESVIK